MFRWNISLSAKPLISEECGQKPSLEQIQAANKKWFNDNDDKCEVSENFDVTTTRQEKI